MNKTEKCPCGSGKKYGECCEPIITGSVPAPTAEALMRARYTSYVVHDIDFIINTCSHRDAERDIDKESTRKWSEESQWLGLSIIRTEKGKESDSEGVVEFVASYNQDGFKDEHHEIAKFIKEAGKWVYESGSMVPTTIVRSTPKVGRNDPCPCGSGKKYKKCCGK